MLNVFFVLFCAVALIHVISCAADRQRVRHITKVFLMPLLALAYIDSCTVINYFALAGMICGWVGDIFLLKPQKKNFQAAGIGAFLVGHICYVIAVSTSIPLTRQIWPWILVGVLFTCVSTVIYVCLWGKIPSNMRGAGIAYFTALTFLAVFGGMTVISGYICGLVLFIGSMFFISSDSILCYQTFTVGSPAPKYDFIVMLTYISAQTCIAWGLCR